MVGRRGLSAAGPTLQKAQLQMMEYLKTQLIRQIDQAAVRELGMPSLLLMENAARGTCEVLESMEPQGRIVIVCGPGNNGGDGLAMARLLAAKGIASDVYLVHGDKTLTDDARSNREFLHRAGIAVYEGETETVCQILTTLASSDWIIDALLGTGIRGDLRSPYREVVESINLSPACVLSIDVPSGLDADQGEPCGVAVHADVTVTFVATKAGFRNESAKSYLGHVEVRHIGIPLRWLIDWCDQQNKGN